MASLVQQLLRSFINTLFYVWTVILALFSLRSPNAFPYRETSTVVPYPLNIDLECGSGGTILVPCSAPSPTLPTSSQNAVQKTICADAHRQESLRCSPAFSSTPPLRSILNVHRGSPDGTLSTLPTGLLVKSSTKTVTDDHERTSPSTSSHAGNEVTEDTNEFSGVTTLDPFLDSNLASPCLLFTGDHDHRQQNALPAFLKLPFTTSTPPRTRKGGKTHKRAALTTITNIAHLNIPVSFDQSYPSPTATEPIVDTPLVQRLRSPSLRRKPAYEDLHSASPMRPRFSDAPPSPTVSSSSSEVQFKSVSPLRIVKRNGGSPVCVQAPSMPEALEAVAYPVKHTEPGPPGVRASAMSEISKVVTSAVRHAFVQTRIEGQDDEGAAARELIQRASVWSCDAVPTGPSRCDMATVQEADESEEEHAGEVTPRASHSPPPPYAFSNPSVNATLGPVTEGTMLQPARSVSSCVSTAFSYLHGNTPVASVDSCLDDILESFEQLMATMPKFKGHIAQSSGHPLSVGGGEAKKSILAVPLVKGQRIVSKDACSRRTTTLWSDVLPLDNY
ncbi:hypothetical protein FPV67DRAFT_1667066 [Lyophyllum atratum]|nr:hypothetical protein FPV67DRAFT_1667066 [Lyophyllum atratum]